MSLEEKVLQKVEESATVCNKCKFFMSLLDPEDSDDDWHVRDEYDMKAVCVYKHKTIARKLKPYQMQKIEIPAWCPKLSK